MARSPNNNLGGLASFLAETPARVEYVGERMAAGYLRPDTRGCINGVSSECAEAYVERYARLVVSGSQRLSRGYECWQLVEAAAALGVMPRETHASLLPDHAQALADLLAHMPAATREGPRRDGSAISRFVPGGRQRA